MMVRFALLSMMLCLASSVTIPGLLSAADLELVAGVPAQPFKSQVKRVVAALEVLGEPLTGEESRSLNAALDEPNDAIAVTLLQKVLDNRALCGVNINAESRVKVARGAAPAKLNEQGWSVFLVKVHNEAGVRSLLRVTSPNAMPVFRGSTGSPEPAASVKPQDIPDRWLEINSFAQQPMVPELSGLTLEYRIIQLYSRDAGKREASIAFDVGQGTQDIGFRNEVPILFDCAPAVKVTVEVLDDDGKPTTGQFVFHDQNGRVYPARSRRLEPDFFFHDQIYRHSGETVLLPPGKYDVTYTRGPEYRIMNREIDVPQAPSHRESFRLKRWIKLTDYRWYSGDHHIHAAGCSHYEAPTAGVLPEAMMRHILGEDLNVGCVLSWGPCWYHQKEFFEGTVHKLSTDRYVMRYDVEVSGFPSSHTGHLCLLRLKEDDYPGTKRIDEWPSWDLPVLKWGKEQGGVVGFSHSGWGLQVPGNDLPNYNMPKFDGIGANEYVVDVVHDVCDFISAVDTPSVWELSIWYHTLNCGYTCRISGETDFPCIYGDRVGLGRIYVKLDESAGKKLDFDDWVSGLKDGRSYCCDGLSHIVDFKVGNLGVGEAGAAGVPSRLSVARGTDLKVRASVASLLEEKPREDIRSKPLDQKPYWHTERARVGDSNRVPVELIVNGKAVARKEIIADGLMAEVEFDWKAEKSSWVALRILPAAHTNPVFVEVDGKPIRADKKSAEWCRDAVDVCWNAKKNNIRESERTAAEAAYKKAAEVYARIAKECEDAE